MVSQATLVYKHSEGYVWQDHARCLVGPCNLQSNEIERLPNDPLR